MSTADKTGRITQALGDRLTCLGMDMNESVNARAAEFNDLMVTIDSLGAETPEMRAERKAAERKPSLGIAHVLSIVATMLIVAALFTVVGAFYGASEPDAVKDLMPSVPSLSGERAEPEESAK